ncbi:hypothetical protein [Solicola sp. PLA-1-18]|jgi:hypothetical protein|uniref:hypothetical protein n=1 Tax=Solicola sp. PLA-1-18 TaxID=3380532 RepID=UPI003B76433B
MAGEDEGAGTTSRTRWLVAGAALVVAVVVVLALALTGGDDDEPSAGDASATPSATPTLSPGATTAPTAPSGATPTPTESPAPTTGPTEAPTPIPTRSPVPIDEPAEFGDGVTARIVSVRSIEGKGQGIGEVDGPSLLVRLELTNDTSRAIPLAQSTVNLAYGRSGDPAPPLFGDERSKPFTGNLAAGDSARAAYVFNVPERQRGRIQVTISHAALSPVVAFQGSAD